MQEGSHRFTERRERRGREGGQDWQKRKREGGGEAYLLKVNTANVHRG